MNDSTQGAALEPLISDAALYAHFESIVMPVIMPNLTYDQWVTMAQTATGKWVRDTYEAERQRTQAALAEHDAKIAALEAAASSALSWIDEIYPADIFDGSSGDEGPVRIVAIRENLRRALHPEQPDSVINLEDE